jgi:hypothetical protein
MPCGVPPMRANRNVPVSRFLAFDLLTWRPGSWARKCGGETVREEMPGRRNSCERDNRGTRVHESESSCFAGLERDDAASPAKSFVGMAGSP